MMRTPVLAQHQVCLGLGSNNEPSRNLPRAISGIERLVALEAVSTAWESPPVDGDGTNFVNAALLVQTSHSQPSLRVVLKEMERQLGRVRDLGRSACLNIDIDIDLLVFDGEIVEDDLWTHAYRAVPLAELVPELICPATGESIFDAAARLSACSWISPRRDILAANRWTTRSLTTPTSSTRTEIS